VGATRKLSTSDIKSVLGLVWKEGDPESWQPTFGHLLYDAENACCPNKISIVPFFGPRSNVSIKVFMACLAGPADPNVRNDYALVDAFKQKLGVPAENC
jgi:hypothetical protein